MILLFCVSALVPVCTLFSLFMPDEETQKLDTMLSDAHAMIERAKKREEGKN